MGSASVAFASFDVSVMLLIDIFYHSKSVNANLAYNNSGGGFNFRFIVLKCRYVGKKDNSLSGRP